MYQKKIDSLEFVPGYPKTKISALEQLKSFPAPQFKPNHQLLPNFLWMDPVYLSGLLQPGYNIKECVSLSTKIQAELSINWHYYFLVSNNLKSFNNYRDTNTFEGSWVNYANLHPELPAAAISFWAQIKPLKRSGTCEDEKVAHIISENLPAHCYLSNKKGEIVSRNFISPLIPLSQLACDFTTQSVYVDSLLSALKRRLQMINENGEVFKLYDDDLLEDDLNIMKEKENYPKLNFNQFQAIKRLEREEAFKNSFMLKPALTGCLYTQYAIDGQNKYRHDYHTMRRLQSKINNQNYATPDFYPRYPYNWKHWQGPWHGLKWIEVCRKTEIAAGDHLFSPFVAAGWDSNERNNIQPAQWLGLLKLLGNMGAAFYYTGFFNVEKEIAKPENYIWQAVMPSYAQAVSSFYEDMLINSKIVGHNLIQYPERDVPVVIRKSNDKKIWVIACSWQSGSSYNHGLPEFKNIEVDLEHRKLKLRARRQGSVYYYSEENSSPVCFQFDGWHEYMHPWYWSKSIVLEAELYGKKIVTANHHLNDYCMAMSAATIDDEITIPFQFHGKNNSLDEIILITKSENLNHKIEIFMDDTPVDDIKVQRSRTFVSHKIKPAKGKFNLANGQHLIRLRTSKSMMLDKVIIEMQR